MTEKATDCDYCPDPIPYGVQCWMIKRGTTVDEVSGKTVPCVKIACQGCYDSEKTKA